MLITGSVTTPLLTMSALTLHSTQLTTQTAIVAFGNFAYFLTERCNCIAKFGYCHGVSSILRLLSLTRVYSDKAAEASITRCLLKSSKVSRLLTWQVSRQNSKESLDQGHTEVVLEFLCGAISRKRCEISSVCNYSVSQPCDVRHSW